MFVIPMMGQSRRFTEAGYTLPKYRLPLHNEPVFRHVVRSFERYFDDDLFLFIARRDHDARKFLDSELRSLGVKHNRIVELEGNTLGQADTVYRGVVDIQSDQPLYIFNIDTIRPGFSKASKANGWDGYLEVFKGEGDHWSFVDPGENRSVKRTTEKQRISDLCSDGLYQFASIALFRDMFEEQLATGLTAQGEYYVAPAYNLLIQRGCRIGYELIDRSEIFFCGTPQEYEDLSRNPPEKWRTSI